MFKGFTLLEVMVALALLAVIFLPLSLVQARTTRLALQARNISIATQLARLQLMECKREVQQIIGSVSDFSLDGDFAEIGQAGFRWECHAPKFNIKAPSASKVEEGFKKKAEDSGKKTDVGATTSVSAPFISMIADSLGNAVRELAVIVRWSDNGTEDEVRVVTHVIDLAPMSALAKMLNEGAKSLQSKDGKKTEENKPENARREGEGPDGQRPPPPPGGLPPAPPPGGGP
jgi:prepilin-type N-terminal cleavage/methylation domain-containing protein